MGTSQQRNGLEEQRPRLRNRPLQVSGLFGMFGWGWYGLRGLFVTHTHSRTWRLPPFFPPLPAMGSRPAGRPAGRPLSHFQLGATWGPLSRANRIHDTHVHRCTKRAISHTVSLCRDWAWRTAEGCCFFFFSLSLWKASKFVYDSVY